MTRTFFALLLALTVNVGAASAESIDILTASAPVDDGLSIIYDAETGGLSVEAPEGTALTTLELRSAQNIFLGGGCSGLDGPFDVCSTEKVFLLLTSGFGSHDFGNVLPSGLTSELLAADLSVDGSTDGGGFNTGSGVYVSTIGVPEPVSLSLFGLGLVCLVTRFRR